MSLSPYRSVLARPGVPALLLVALLARVPLTAAPVVLTLHVVLDLGHGFALAGLVGGAFAVGAALGAPLLGRGFDRLGLRPVLVVTTVVETGFWLASPHLGLGALVGTAFAGGLLSIPVFALTRQAVSAMVPPGDRHAAFSLDSMGVELSFAVGPAAGIALLTATGASTTLLTLALLVLAGGVALLVLDPPVHGDDARLPADARVAPAPPVAGARLAWVTPSVLALLVVTTATTLTVVGTETALTAVMTDIGSVGYLGLVLAVWCVASLVGGFVYGASRRRPSPALVLALLAVTALPAALAQGWVALLLLVIPTGLFCAPAIALTAEVLTATTPAGVRGLALGLHSSALTVGNAVGAPLVGLVVDVASPRSGFVAVAVMGLALALVAVVVEARGRGRRPGARTPVTTGPVGPAGASVGLNA